MERIRDRQGRTYITRSGQKRVEGATTQQHGERTDKQSSETFINPYSYESAPEARVQLELESRQIRFAYRFFTGSDSAVHVHKLIPDFAPEFTLPDYKVVIIIQGDFYGSLPGVIDKAALSQVLLKADGWKTAIWTQSEIVTEGAAVLMHRDLPQLDKPTFIGNEIPSPYGHPLTMETRRQYLRGLALLKTLFTPKAVIGAIQGSSLRGFTRHIRRSNTDNGRYRPGSDSRGKGTE